ncbi:hypothetical protein ACSMXM_14170 [Pacificimonas sp. ICDLI1SI03]
MKAGLLLILPMLLAGCFEPDSRVTEEPEVKTVPAPKAPPPDPRRYIGRWAKTAGQCESDWWRFWADELRTKTAGLFCEIMPPDARFSDTDLRTSCVDDGRRVRESWTISYGPDAASMTITGEDEDAEPVELVKCT